MWAKSDLCNLVNLDYCSIIELQGAMTGDDGVSVGWAITAVQVVEDQRARHRIGFYPRKEEAEAAIDDFLRAICSGK